MTASDRLVHFVAIGALMLAGCAAKSGGIQGEFGGGDPAAGSGGSQVSSGAGSTGPTGSGGRPSSSSTGAGAGSGGGPLDGVTCSGAGSFCGNHGAAGGDPGTLYVCAGPGLSPVSSSACSSGCQTNASSPDQCKTAGCSGNGVCCPGTGLYCGGDQITGDSSTLYTCAGDNVAPASSQPCASGCKVNAPGTGDACKASLTCAGSGDYCGGDEMSGDTNTLYHCSGAGQAPTSSTPCSSGCVVMAAGHPDVCRVGLSCSGSGAYCGADGVQGGDANTLYHCPGAGQAPSSSQVCSGGCSIQPPGTADSCSSAGTCPGSGDYCGGDGVSGPSNVLYHCNGSGEAPASSTTCSAGCTVEPSGTPDFCASPGMGSCSAVARAALNWEENQLNTGNSWSDLCLGFVYNAFVNAGDTIGYLQRSTAADSLAAAKATGHFVAWNGSCSLRRDPLLGGELVQRRGRSHRDLQRRRHRLVVGMAGLQRQREREHLVARQRGMRRDPKRLHPSLNQSTPLTATGLVNLGRPRGVTVSISRGRLFPRKHMGHATPPTPQSSRFKPVS